MQAELSGRLNGSEVCRIGDAHAVHVLAEDDHGKLLGWHGEQHHLEVTGSGLIDRDIMQAAKCAAALVQTMSKNLQLIITMKRAKVTSASSME